MATRQTLVVVSVVVVATLTAVGPAVGVSAIAVDGPVDTANAVTAEDLAQTADEGTGQTESGANVTDGGGADGQFGTQMAAFMQSNAAQVNDSVEDGMWEAAFERANESERARMATSRTESLQGRLNALEAQNHSLYQRYRNGSITTESYVVRASQLNGRLEALEDGVGGTARTAERTGLNLSALDELRTSARNLSGPEVAGVARGLVDGDTGPPEGVPGRGPPDAPGDGPDRGTPTAETVADPDENATGTATEGPGNGPENPGNGEGPPGNGNDNGPSGNGNGEGPPGNGNDNGPPGNSNGEGPEDSDGEGDGSENDGDDTPGNGANPGNSNGEGPSGNGDDDDEEDDGSEDEDDSDENDGGEDDEDDDDAEGDGDGDDEEDDDEDDDE